jgi:hypothetical protein
MKPGVPEGRYTAGVKWALVAEEGVAALSVVSLVCGPWSGHVVSIPGVRSKLVTSV